MWAGRIRYLNRRRIRLNVESTMKVMFLVAVAISMWLWSVDDDALRHRMLLAEASSSSEAPKPYDRWLFLLSLLLSLLDFSRYGQLLFASHIGLANIVSICRTFPFPFSQERHRRWSILLLFSWLIFSASFCSVFYNKIIPHWILIANSYWLLRPSVSFWKTKETWI